MKIRKFWFTCLLLTTAIHLSLFGDAIQLSNTIYDSHWPAIAVNYKGEIMAVFTEEISGQTDIFYTISTDGGKTWSPSKQTFSVKSYIKSCDLAADSDGNFHLAYADGASSANREIYYRYYNNGKWETPERISFSWDNSNWCHIDVEGDTVYIVWYQEVGWPNKPIAALKSKKVGGQWPKEREDASNNPSNGHIYPDLSVENGNIYVIFQTQQYSNNIVETKYIGFNQKIGEYWGAPKKIGFYTWPAIEADSYGNVHCLYPNVDKVNYNVRTGEDWQGDKSINTRSGWAGFFDIAYKNNVLVAAWVANASRSSDHSGAYYSLKKFDGRWGAWGPNIEVDVAANIVEAPKIAMDNYGYMHLICLDKIFNGTKQVWYYKFLVGTPVALEVDTSSLDFEGSGTQTFKLKTFGEKSMGFRIETDQDWIKVSPKKGRATKEWQTIEVAVDASDLKSGTYTGTVQVIAKKDEENPIPIQVNLTVTLPEIKLNKSSLSFEAVEMGENPGSKKFRVSNSGAETLNYEISVSYLSQEEGWMTVSPTSGSSTGEEDDITVSVDITSLIEGEYEALIEISSPRAENSPQKIDVILTVLPPPIYAPLDFAVDKKENISLFHREMIHICTWEVNPDNKMIIQYKLYWEYEDNGEIIRKTVELDSDTFRYEIRNVDKDKQYTYYLVAVDYQGREGEAAVIIVE